VKVEVSAVAPALTWHAAGIRLAGDVLAAKQLAPSCKSCHPGCQAPQNGHCKGRIHPRYTPRIQCALATPRDAPRRPRTSSSCMPFALAPMRRIVSRSSFGLSRKGVSRARLLPRVEGGGRPRHANELGAPRGARRRPSRPGQAAPGLLCSMSCLWRMFCGLVVKAAGHLLLGQLGAG
jgi:hypothetical protein